MQNITHSVYIKINKSNEVVNVNSDIFINDLRDWIKIDEGAGDKYAHAQQHYFDIPLKDIYGNYLLLYEDGIVIKKTAIIMLEYES